MRKIGYWIEAMRLRTLPVSLAGVVLAMGYAGMHGNFNLIPAILCLVFALLAQIASNFANEYYDYKSGLDKKGRVGPRRGVTEGDITPKAMKAATYVTLATACAVGCVLIFYGGWWLIAVGLLIAVGVIAYSSGPYPLSHHGLGEVAVLFFFGIIPVNLTYYVMSGEWIVEVLLASVSAGLMGANVLIVNNYRDMDDDKAVNKRTLAVILGRKTVAALYLFSGYWAVALMVPVWLKLAPATWIVPVAYLALHTVLWLKLQSLIGQRLNPMLGATAMAMAFYCFSFAVISMFA